MSSKNEAVEINGVGSIRMSNVVNVLIIPFTLSSKPDSEWIAIFNRVYHAERWQSNNRGASVVGSSIEALGTLGEMEGIKDIFRWRYCRN